MRFHILDNGLGEAHGHHDHFARGFIQAARAQGHEAVVYGQADMSPALMAEFGARPLFKGSQYLPLIEDPQDGPLIDFLERRRRLARELKALDGEVAPEDVVLLPTASPALLSATGIWRRGASVKPKVAALFHRTGEPWGAGTVATAICRTSVRPFSNDPPGRFWCAATNAVLAQRLREVFQRDVAWSAQLSWFVQPFGAAKAPEPGEDIRIGFIGTARQEKGGGLTPTIVRLGLQRNERYRFIVHGHGAELDSFYAGLKGHPRFELYKSWMDEQDFARLVRSLHVVVLPYERAAYAPMVSGILAMAAGYARPCAAPSGTWMARQIKAGRAAGVCFDSGHPLAVMKAVDQLVADLPAYQQAALEAAPKARAAFGIEGLVTDLARWAGGEPAAQPAAKPARKSPAQNTAVAARPPQVLICCYHKTGTVLFGNLLQRLVKALGVNVQERPGRISALDPAAQVTLAWHSLFADRFKLEPWLRVARIVRDPRDIWVSSYLYHRRCDEEWCVGEDFDATAPIRFPRVDFPFEPLPEAQKRAYLKRLGGRSYQQNLLDRDQASGLQFELEGYTGLTLAAMRTWRFAGPQVLQLKLETINADFDGSMRRLFRHMTLSAKAQEIALAAAAAEDISRMSDEELAKRSHVHSRSLSKWRDVLTPAQVEAFERRYGDLIEGLGYELSTARTHPREPAA